MQSFVITCCAERRRYCKIFKYFFILIFCYKLGINFSCLAGKLPFPWNNKGQYPLAMDRKIDKIGETLEQLQPNWNIPRLKDTSLFIKLSKGRQLSPCMSDPIGTRREILCRNRQGVRLHSATKKKEWNEIQSKGIDGF